MRADREDVDCEDVDRDEAPFHHGELAVQAQAGVRATAQRVGGIIAPAIAPPLAAFLRSARVVALGAADRDGHVWASLLVGAPGVVEPTAQHLTVAMLPAVDDALYARLRGRDDAHAVGAPGAPGAPVGLVAIDFATRRRVRVNGRLAPPTADAAFTIAVEEAYGNCPKYIQARAPAATAAPGVAWAPPPVVPALSNRLTPAQQRWIRAADTSFVASVGPRGRADASHRGGAPGFMAVPNAQHIVLPDYPGNALFNTLGNLAVDPRVGIVVPDFAAGHVLQLSGTAVIDWRPEATTGFPGAERVVVVRITHVVEVAAAIPAGWSPAAPSPFNPPAPSPPTRDGARRSAP